MQPIASLSRTCGALNMYMGSNTVSGSGWNLPNSLTEAGSATKFNMGTQHYGGVLCCKNVSSSCGTGTFSLPVNTGCSDGTREWFIDRTLYPDIAGCSGGFSVPGIASNNVGVTNRPCASVAGNDSPNPIGTGCSAAGSVFLHV